MSRPQITRAELLPTGRIRDWKLWKEQKELVERLRAEHLAAQRRGEIPATPHTPNPTPREPGYEVPEYLLHPHYERTFEQWARTNKPGSRPYSWMSTSPYNMTGVETRDKE